MRAHDKNNTKLVREKSEPTHMGSKIICCAQGTHLPNHLGGRMASGAIREMSRFLTRMATWIFCVDGHVVLLVVARTAPFPDDWPAAMSYQCSDFAREEVSRCWLPLCDLFSKQRPLTSSSLRARSKRRSAFGHPLHLPVQLGQLNCDVSSASNCIIETRPRGAQSLTESRCVAQ